MKRLFFYLIIIGIMLTGCGKSDAGLAADTTKPIIEETTTMRTEVSGVKYKATKEIANASPYDNKLQFGNSCVTFPAKVSTLLNLGATIEAGNTPSGIEEFDENSDVTVDRYCTLEFKGQKMKAHIKNVGESPRAAIKDCTVIEIDILKINPNSPIFLPGGIPLDTTADEVENVLGTPTRVEEDNRSSNYAYIYSKKLAENNTYFDLAFSNKTNKLVFVKGFYLEDNTTPIEKRVNTYIENADSGILFHPITYAVPEFFSGIPIYNSDSKNMEFDNHEYRCLVSFNDFVYPKHTYTTGNRLINNMREELENTQISELSNTDKSVIVGKIIQRAGGYIVHTYVFDKETGYAFASASYSILPINENEIVSEKAFEEITEYAVGIINTYKILTQTSHIGRLYY